MSPTRVSCSEYSFPAVPGQDERSPDVDTCFSRFAEFGVGERWQASMEGLVVGLTDASGALVRSTEDWHLD